MSRAALLSWAILLGARWKSVLPSSLAAVIIATVTAQLAGLSLPMIGALPAGFPAPTLAFFDVSRVGDLLPSAFVVDALAALAALAALESPLCATVADAMSVGERHDPDRELFGQGVANIVVPLFGGVPATAAIARTAFNVRAGARSRVASITHSLVLAAIVPVASPLVGGIPIAAPAGVLLATTVHMIEVSSISALLRSTRADAAVLLLTLGVTVALDLVTAVASGSQRPECSRCGQWPDPRGFRSRRSTPRCRSTVSAARRNAPSWTSTSSPTGSMARCSSARRPASCSNSPRSRT